MEIVWDKLAVLTANKDVSKRGSLASVLAMIDTLADQKQSQGLTQETNEESTQEMSSPE